jgi:hypothetical protein
MDISYVWIHSSSSRNDRTYVWKFIYEWLCLIRFRGNARLLESSLKKNYFILGKEQSFVDTSLQTHTHTRKDVIDTPLPLPRWRTPETVSYKSCGRCCVGLGLCFMVRKETDAWPKHKMYWTPTWKRRRPEIMRLRKVYKMVRGAGQSEVYDAWKAVRNECNTLIKKLEGKTPLLDLGIDSCSGWFLWRYFMSTIIKLCVA